MLLTVDILLLLLLLLLLLQLSCHSVVVLLALLQTKQIRINIHKRNNTKIQYKQYKYNKYKYTYYQNTHNCNLNLYRVFHEFWTCWELVLLFFLLLLINFWLRRHKDAGCVQVLDMLPSFDIYWCHNMNTAGGILKINVNYNSCAPL